MIQNGLTPSYDLVGDLFRFFCFKHDPAWTRRQKYQLLEHHESPQALIDWYDPHYENSTLNASQSSALKKAAEFLRASNHHCLVLGQTNYPPLLAQIADPPFVLYAIGDISLLVAPCIAMVGSRRPTQLGVNSTQAFASQLASMGITTVSGMALGVDGYAHEATLCASGSTIAVLACGADVVYPARHRALYQRIAKRGLVLSEYPPGTSALPFRFPERNRLVSGLSLGTLIIEAADKSGTLITARYCIEHNRDLFVVPGSLQSAQYEGSHRLIQQGAYLATNANDIVSVLASELSEQISVFRKSSDLDLEILDISLAERTVLNLLRRETMSTDLIVKEAGLSVATVSAALLNLELEGLAGRAQDGQFHAIS